MPDKRNPSKQRRAARNRASREALAARRDNAVAVPSAPATGSTKASSSSTASSRTASKGGARAAGGRAAARPVAVAAGPPPKGIGGYLRSKRPGDKAVLLAFLLAIVSSLLLLFLLDVTVDDRGDAIPPQYGALTIAARQAITGSEDVTSSESTLSAYGPAALLMAATPVLIAGYALWANRRNDRARLLTFALIAMAMASLFTGGLTIFLPPLLALGVGTFRIRKADMVAGMAAAPPEPAGGGRGGVIEADTVDDEAAPAKPSSLLDRLLGGGAAGGVRRGGTADDEVSAVDEGAPETADDTANPVAAGPVDAAPAEAGPADADRTSGGEHDPLAELEAELAAEADAAEADGEDTSSGESRGRRRR